MAPLTLGALKSFAVKVKMLPVLVLHSSLPPGLPRCCSFVMSILTVECWVVLVS